MRALLLVLALFAASARAPLLAQEPPAWFTESLLELPDDIAAAATEKKRVMLYFGQDGCPYCKRLMEVNFRQAAIAAKAQKNLVALAVNIWGDREVKWVDGSVTSEKKLAAQIKVQYTPTLIFFDERGAIALRLNGYLPPHEFEAALDYVAQRMEKKQTFREYLRAKAPAPAKAALNAQPFFKAPEDLRRTPGAKPLALLFETPECSACDELHAVAFKRREVLDQLARYDVVRLPLAGREPLVGVDGRKTTAAGLAGALNVGYVPALVLFDANGREAFRSEAYLRPFHFAGALEYVSSGAYRREPSFQRFLQERAELMRARGEAVDLWN